MAGKDFLSLTESSAASVEASLKETLAFLRAMKVGLSLYIVGAGMLLALVGCGRGFMSGERAPWRHDAEVACMKSGSVKINASVVQINPIEGPGMCGADFPLKVAALGESSSLVGYADDPRPPGSIPNGSQMPRWPVNDSQYAPTAAIPSVQSGSPPKMRWVPGPPPAENPGYGAPTGQPVSLSAPIQMQPALAARAQMPLNPKSGLAIDLRAAPPEVSWISRVVASRRVQRAANVLEWTLRSEAPVIVALGTGRAVRAAVERVSPIDCPNHQIVSLVGNISADGSASFFDTVGRLAELTKHEGRGT